MDFVHEAIISEKSLLNRTRMLTCATLPKTIFPIEESKIIHYCGHFRLETPPNYFIHTLFVTGRKDYFMSN